ncbi:ScbR family autoregulator-binding transcription factor [Streptomyces coacervatus]|uniref:ScbR family autoregulator-binding transcription factor n=1 Tax=Streptomyces coacervatus TaxID=647381 RepID=A0ABP7HQF9_9ACTN|nr:TetR/AcrR family transcriptional regulator [Streptomyces coacervatus]MDF2270965.1 TetR/AcrR family transcriptional regulator [Streptomyces coacervatus]
MPRQERAEQTRQRIVRAAAAEFAEHGYDGTSLHRIVRSAGVTMGALTFHFPSKSALADAVQEAGTTATREVMLIAAPAPGLQGVLDGVLTLADALRTTQSIRAAARLTREGHAADHGWYGSWAPGLREALERAWREEHLDGGLTAPAAASLLSHVLLGVETAATAPDAVRTITGDGPEETLTEALKALGTLLAPNSPH